MSFLNLAVVRINSKGVHRSAVVIAVLSEATMSYVLVVFAESV
jgi:hypothetical protein